MTDTTGIPTPEPSGPAAAPGSSPVPQQAQHSRQTPPEQQGPQQGHGRAVPDPRESLVAVRSEVGKSVVGQEAAVTGLVIAMLAGGPNLLLADEINRTPPKTQAALLEAMEERQVSVDGEPRPLPDPFMVIATQNPVEYEGIQMRPEAEMEHPDAARGRDGGHDHPGGHRVRPALGAGAALRRPRSL